MVHRFTLLERKLGYDYTFTWTNAQCVYTSYMPCYHCLGRFLSRLDFQDDLCQYCFLKLHFQSQQDGFPKLSHFMPSNVLHFTLFAFKSDGSFYLSCNIFTDAVPGRLFLKRSFVRNVSKNICTINANQQCRLVPLDSLYQRMRSRHRQLRPLRFRLATFVSTFNLPYYLVLISGVTVEV